MSLQSPNFGGFALLHQGEGYVAIDKPPGLPVIPGRGEARSIRELLETAVGRKIFVVHRLDRDTSGVLLFALEPSTHRALSMAFEAGAIQKRYLALVRGDLSGLLDLDLPLVSARKGRMRVARPGEEGKHSRTLVSPVERLGKATLVEATPLTGRTHQIRVHLAHAGHPLLFDHQYARESEALGLERTPLHARALSLPALGSMRAVEIRSPLPADMARTLDLLRLNARQ